MRQKLLPELRVGFQKIRDLCRLFELSCVGSGFNKSHLQPERPHFLREGFVERFDSPFRSAIEADERQCRYPQPARNTENVTAPLFPQQRQSRSEHSDDAEVVRIEEAADLLIARFLCSRE